MVPNKEEKEGARASRQTDRQTGRRQVHALLCKHWAQLFGACKLTCVLLKLIGGSQEEVQTGRPVQAAAHLQNRVNAHWGLKRKRNQVSGAPVWFLFMVATLMSKEGAFSRNYVSLFWRHTGAVAITIGNNNDRSQGQQTSLSPNATVVP